MGQFRDSPHMDHSPIVLSSNKNEYKASKNIKQFDTLLKKKDQGID